MKLRKYKHIAEYRAYIRSKKDKHSKVLFELLKRLYVSTLMPISNRKAFLNLQ